MLFYRIYKEEITYNWSVRSVNIQLKHDSNFKEKFKVFKIYLELNNFEYDNNRIMITIQYLYTIHLHKK